MKYFLIILPLLAVGKQRAPTELNWVKYYCEELMPKQNCTADGKSCWVMEETSKEIDRRLSCLEAKVRMLEQRK